MNKLLIEGLGVSSGFERKTVKTEVKKEKTIPNELIEKKKAQGL